MSTHHERLCDGFYIKLEDKKGKLAKFNGEWNFSLLAIMPETGIVKSFFAIFQRWSSRSSMVKLEDHSAKLSMHHFLFLLLQSAHRLLVCLRHINQDMTLTQLGRPAFQLVDGPWQHFNTLARLEEPAPRQLR